MKAYSLDLRQRVIRAYEQGQDFIAQLGTRWNLLLACGPTKITDLLTDYLTFAA